MMTTRIDGEGARMRRWSWRGWLVAFAVLLRSVGVTGCDSGRSTKSPNGTGGGALPAAGGAGGFRDGVGGAPLGGASGGNAVGGGPGGENFGGNAVGGGPGGRNLGGHGGAAGNGSGAGGAVAPTDCLPGFTDGGQLAGVPTAKVLVVDLNGDGKQDLLVADINTMKVFINDGSGRLTGHGSYGIGARISMDVAAGDLNGDGRLDVAVAFGVPRGQIALTPPQAAVFLNEGDGTLTMLPPIDLPAAATGIAIGDVDGDHHVDLVLSTSTAGPYILQNLQGDGHVAPAVSINAALGATTLGDANGDGKLDLLLLSAGRLQVWLNQGGLVFSLLEGALPPNLSVFSYVATDLNGDGFPDLAMLGVVPMSGLGYRTVIVALNDGRGNFASRFTVNVDEKSQTLVVGDFDRDGHPDLAVSIPNVRPPNVGIGNLATFMAGPGGTYVAGTCSTVLLAGGALAAGDLSGDGAADLAVAAERGVDLLFSAVLVTAGPAGP